MNEKPEITTRELDATTILLRNVLIILGRRVLNISVLNLSVIFNLSREHIYTILGPSGFDDSEVEEIMRNLPEDKK